jgi:hypothetical protein
MPRILVAGLAAAALAAAVAPAAPPARAAEPCNPVIDGFYCETNMSRVRVQPRGNSLGGAGVQSIGADISPSYDPPATFGAITFQGNGQRCIGLLFRSNCT